MSASDPGERAFLQIGDGELGGKAQGLVFFGEMLRAEYEPDRFPSIEVCVPDFAVLATDLFDRFVEDNGLLDLALSDASDEQIARAFQAAPFPESLMQDLARVVDTIEGPLAVRSSSLMEDAIFCPFAGVYHTKMIPNNQPAASLRLAKLVESVKLIYASTFFSSAKSYFQAIGRDLQDEKMAVIVQGVVGTRFGDRFYPTLSGVGRSFNFYASCGNRPENGIVNLALGLGKTIVDGGFCWCYSPARPKAPPPYGSARELIEHSQRNFWCIELGEITRPDPIAEDEFLVEAGLAEAELDGVLPLVASTYDGGRDRIVPGIGCDGPRVINFGPLLSFGELPLNGVLRELLTICERAAGGEVEIEFAMGRPDPVSGRARLGFLQVRPMAVCHEEVRIDEASLDNPDLLLASRHVMGNGSIDNVRDVVFVKPEVFDPRFTAAIAEQLGPLNRLLLQRERPYVLIGFGRWGSADPWLGVPVEWSQISGARIIVEATLPGMNVEASQGSHFFHNLTGCGVGYLSVHHESRPAIDWDWLQSLEPSAETPFVRHVELSEPLTIKVDGHRNLGAIWRPR